MLAIWSTAWFGCAGDAETTGKSDGDADADTDTDTDTDTDADNDTEPERTSYAWSALIGVAKVMRAWMDRERFADGTEHLVGVSEVDLDAVGLAVDWQIAEDLTLSASGSPTRWTQHHRYAVYAATFEYRYAWDAATRTLEVAHQGVGGSWTIGGTEPVLLAPWPTDPFFYGSATSPVVGTAYRRLLDQGEPFALVSTFFGTSTVLAPEVPTDCGELYADTYCWDADGVPDFYRSVYLSATAVRTDELVDLPAFESPAATEVVDTPDCAIPPEGDPRHRTFRVDSADGTEIAGRIVLPAGTGPFPTVVISTGTGGTDRHGSYNGLGHWDCAAAHLTALGIAVVSVDDRGWGESTGGISDPFYGRDEDTAAVVTWAAGEPDVGALFVLGHSEGVAHACAAAAAVPEVDGLILASGIAGPFAEFAPDQVAVWLGAVGADQSTIDANAAWWVDFAADVLAGTYPGEVVGGRPVDTYWLPFFQADGTALALATTEPVLLVQGGLDFQVPPHNADELLLALQGAGRDVELQFDPALGHFLQPALDNLPVGLEYGLPWAIDPALLDGIAAWVLDHG